MMEVQSADNSIFTRDHIKYWDGIYSYDEDQDISFVNIDGELKPINVFAGVDPATDSARRDADYSVIMIIGVDSDSRLYV